MVALTRMQRPNVLVGYDGTEENDVALRWAVEESRLRGLDLMICYCWHWPYPREHVDGGVQAVIQRARTSCAKACGGRGSWGRPGRCARG